MSFLYCVHPVTCGLKQDAGSKCSDYTITWAYDGEKGRCERFWYGGCDGNDNRFLSDEKCMEFCSGKKLGNSPTTEFTETKLMGFIMKLNSHYEGTKT